MRARTFFLFILVLIVAAVVVVLGFVYADWGRFLGLGSSSGGDTGQQVAQEGGEEPGLPPTPTPLPMSGVVVAAIDIPVGQVITAEYLTVQQRPDTNIAVQAGDAITNLEDAVGRIARTDIDMGQEVLNSMVAVTPNDLLSLGSDLSLYVTAGQVAVAFPIDRYSGAAFAMRPGDAVDVIMTIPFVKVDEEFQSALPNLESRVDSQALQDGQQFLFSPTARGRLELVPGIDLVASIGPGGVASWDFAGGGLLQIPRRATQLTVQQARVIWVGTWKDPLALAEEQQALAAQAETSGQPVPTPVSPLERRENRPDVVILSLSAQDALVLKWALDRGLNIDLVLRAQGDSSVFFTTSVSLPQLVQQSGLTIPLQGEWDVDPRADEVLPPSVPPNPPDN